MMKSQILWSSTLGLLLLHVHVLSAGDTITPGQLIPDGVTVVSGGGGFELGFFSPDGSKNRYVGIWYKEIAVMTPVWVANRESPLTTPLPLVSKNKTTSAGFLTLTSSGQLVILDSAQKNATIWSSSNTNTNTRGVARNPKVQLLESGNLVIHDEENSNNYLWQSFDHPTDTLIPGMSLSWNPVVGTERYLSSWTSSVDPSPGDSTFGLTGSYPQVCTTRGGEMMYRLGPWNAIQFNSNQRLKPQNNTNNDSLVYFVPLTTDKSVVSRFTLNSSGVVQPWTWVLNQSYVWGFSYNFPGDICDIYKTCGPNSLCNILNINSPCQCLSRFRPKIKAGWALNDWSAGCIRRYPLNCATDVFYGFSALRMPYSLHMNFYPGNSTLQCNTLCFTNCSCTAYAFVTTGCILWFGDLLDLRIIHGADQLIYVRISLSELESDKRKRKQRISVFTSSSAILLLSVVLALLFKWNKYINQKRRQRGLDSEDFQLPMYDLSTVIKATHSFSDDNKLGEGGFGSVYKGILEDGMQVAVKRLSETSSQGPDEFKNEVICIAKLQHRNLVKLLGYCIQGNEKILLYEYMPNKSLDLVLYDKTNGLQLDWSKRFHIINGIARGILYLHQDSQLRIIHRDLKASNVLLDNDLNPKISDFGMARIFGGDETEAQTNRVVGTYGYMSPEYAGRGLFSIKSDVYSFGVLALEIVSGQKNRGFEHDNHDHNLIGHAWILHKAGMSMELVDPNIVSTVSSNEILRSIHVALLCVQKSPDDRPSMGSVVLMLGSGGALPETGQPGFFVESHGDGTGRTGSTITERPSNECSMTELAPR